MERCLRCLRGDPCYGCGMSIVSSEALLRLRAAAGVMRSAFPVWRRERMVAVVRFRTVALWLSGCDIAVTTALRIVRGLPICIGATISVATSERYRAYALRATDGVCCWLASRRAVLRHAGACARTRRVCARSRLVLALRDLRYARTLVRLCVVR